MTAAIKFYISYAEPDIKDFLDALREHWSIENYTGSFQEQVISGLSLL